MEDGQDRRQRNRVQIVAEADRRDVVEADLDIVGGEVAQRRRHQPDQPVEDDFQHRQAFVGDEGGIDDGPDAALVLHLLVVDVEAQEGIDFLLVQDTLGGRCGGNGVGSGAVAGGLAFGLGRAGLVFGGGVGFVGHGYCTIISLSSTSRT